MFGLKSGNGYKSVGEMELKINKEMDPGRT